MRSANPALGEKTFEQFGGYTAADTTAMTVQGTAIKTGVLLLMAVTTAAWSWMQLTRNPEMAMGITFGGAIGGLIFAMITIFKANWAPVTAPIYALLEGLFLGGVSGLIQAQIPDVPIVFQAVCLTFGTMFSLLIAYQTGWIRATENFKLGVFAATGGIALIYLISMVMRLFGAEMPFIHSAGWMGIGFSVVVVIIAALNLVLDFDFIEEGANRGAPKYMEWYGAFGLMVTLVWLYLEILRLLAKLNSRD